MTETWEEYQAMRDAAVRVTGPLFNQFVKECQKNIWLKVGGPEFEPEGLCGEHDYPFYLERYDDINMLQKFFEHGNWGIRSAVQHKDLIFVNQVNGGCEWLTMKVVSDTELVSFESLSMKLIIKGGEFQAHIDAMTSSTAAQCKNGEWYKTMCEAANESKMAT